MTTRTSIPQPELTEEFEDDDEYSCFHNASEMKAEMNFLAKKIQEKKDAEAEAAYLRHVLAFHGSN